MHPSAALSGKIGVFIVAKRDGHFGWAFQAPFDWHHVKYPRDSATRILTL